MMDIAEVRERLKQIRIKADNEEDQAFADWLVAATLEDITDLDIQAELDKHKEQNTDE